MYAYIKKTHSVIKAYKQTFLVQSFILFFSGTNKERGKHFLIWIQPLLVTDGFD